MVDVWSPIFTMMMFEMANLRSALFRALFLQFSRGISHGNITPEAMLADQPPVWLSFSLI